MTENTKMVLDYIEANYVGYEERYDFCVFAPGGQFNDLLNRKIKEEIGTTIAYSTLKRYFNIEKKWVEYTFINEDDEEEEDGYELYIIGKRK